MRDNIVFHACGVLMRINGGEQMLQLMTDPHSLQQRERWETIQVMDMFAGSEVKNYRYTKTRQDSVSPSNFRCLQNSQDLLVEASAGSHCVEESFHRLRCKA